VDLRELPPVDIGSCFKWKGVVEKTMTSLPRMDEYLSEEGFAELSLAWSEGGLKVHLSVESTFKGSFFPDVEKGDGLELFIDTRGVEEALVMHKYCHHFIFLPKEVDGIIGAEVTSFRGEDKHIPADPENFEVKTTFQRMGYTMEILIPEICLFGYDDRGEDPWIGFAFRLHRQGEKPMHFPVSSVDLKMEAHPALWARLQLI